jgi:hypothetical protein
VSHLRHLHQRRDRLSAIRKIEECGLRRHVVVPHIVVHGLEAPDHLAVRSVQGHHRAREVVEATAIATVVVGRGIPGRGKDKTALWIDRQDRPHIRGAPAVDVLAGGRIELHRALARRDGVPAPAQLAATRVVSAHHPGGRIAAAVVEHVAARHHEVADHHRRRGDAVLPRIHAPNALTQVDLALLAEIFTGLPAMRIQRDQTRVERAHEDAPRAAAPGLAPGIVPGGNTTAHLQVTRGRVQLGVEAPAFAASVGIERDHAIERRAQVERVVHEDRCVLERARCQAGGAVVVIAGVIDPGDLELPNVVLVDLSERRVVTSALGRTILGPAGHRAFVLDRRRVRAADHHYRSQR